MKATGSFKIQAMELKLSVSISYTTSLMTKVIAFYKIKCNNFNTLNEL